MAIDMIRTVSPIDGEVIYETEGTTLSDAKNIIEKSESAFKLYRKTSLSERKEVVAKAIGLLRDRRDELGRELTVQMGRPIAFTAKEIDTMHLRADYLLSISEDALKDLPGVPQAGFRRWISKEPVGPVLLVFPWNFPYLTLINALVPALLAGNSVLLKPSPQTPLVARSFLQAFTEAGLPQDTLQIIQSGNTDMLREIVNFPAIQLVAFTGSTTVGIGLREATARRILPVSLELGGNDPAYVRHDADVKYTAAQLVDGALFNSGQSCCSVERVYAHADIYDELIRAMQEELKLYKLGNPLERSTNIGPVVSQAAVKNINAQVEDALAKGAIDKTPNNETFMSAPRGGSFVAPRLLVDVDHSMSVMRDETFGPIIPVARVSSDEEAIALMNDSEYGLTASVWTKDIGKGQQITEQLEAGTVFVNRCDYPSPDLAWTGWKTSGMGSTLGPKGFDGFVKLKSHHIKESQT